MQLLNQSLHLGWTDREDSNCSEKAGIKRKVEEMLELCLVFSVHCTKCTVRLNSKYQLIEFIKSKKNHNKK